MILIFCKISGKGEFLKSGSFCMEYIIPIKIQFYFHPNLWIRNPQIFQCFGRKHNILLSFGIFACYLRICRSKNFLKRTFICHNTITIFKILAQQLPCKFLFSCFRYVRQTAKLLCHFLCPIFDIGRWGHSIGSDILLNIHLQLPIYQT